MVMLLNALMLCPEVPPSTTKTPSVPNKGTKCILPEDNLAITGVLKVTKPPSLVLVHVDEAKSKDSKPGKG